MGPFLAYLATVRSKAEKSAPTECNAYDRSFDNVVTAVAVVPHGSDVDEDKMVSPKQAFTIFMLITIAAVLVFCILGEHVTIASGLMGSARTPGQPTMDGPGPSYN